MIKFGLTGSIATGKSEVARLFRERGMPVFDADSAVHELYMDPVVVAEIEKLFPSVVIKGRVDRGSLGALLARQPSAVGKLEALVHPLVRGRREAFLRATAREPIVLFDIPLLFETGAEREMDAVIVVTTTAELQRARALARPGMTEEKLDFIVSRQLSMLEQAARADFVIENTGSLDDLAGMVDSLIPHLRTMAGVRA